MKKLFILAFAAIALVSCSSGPEKAAKNFTENLAKGKIDEAKKYATEPTGKLLDMAAAFGGNKIENPDFKFEAIKDSVADNHAWVTYKGKDGGEETIELVKIDGDWKVSIEPQK